MFLKIDLIKDLQVTHENNNPKMLFNNSFHIIRHLLPVVLYR